MATTPAPRASDGPAVPTAADPLASPRDVRLFWWASTSDALGTQTSGIVLPLLLLTLGYSPAAVGLIAGASAAFGLLLGPLAAVPADRGARKTVMLWSAGLAALAMATVSVMVTMGRPPLVLLLCAVLVERLCTAAYDAAARGTVAMICPPEGYPRLVARLEVGDNVALVLGPLLGGALYQLGRAWPFVVDALSYAVTAVCVGFMRADLRAAGNGTAPATAPTDRPSDGERGTARTGPSREGPDRRERRLRREALLTEAGAGLRLVGTTPLLRLVTLWTAVVNGALSALYFGVLFSLERDGHSGSATGLVLAVSGAAGIAGALAAPALTVRLGAARTFLTVTWLLVPLAAGLAAARSPWAFAVLFGGVCLILPCATVVLQSRTIATTPPHLQARAGAVLAAAAGGAAAVGPAAAGLLAARAGSAGPALGCTAALIALAAYTGLAHPRTLKDTGSTS
ncbi:MFS transporter [Streptomyces sp. BE147]|uniref:MFS transporter n=1 Tax=Streptomyces sp. BE147 TaxID=3002524 RepID=UPI002E78B792|nr:MFS transporter [Streptomyces sp. BE147]MEE1736590.1 MFS transporter [Streptomyces sp. BE147]